MQDTSFYNTPACPASFVLWHTPPVKNSLNINASMGLKIKKHPQQKKIAFTSLRQNHFSDAFLKSKSHLMLRQGPSIHLEREQLHLSLEFDRTS